MYTFVLACHVVLAVILVSLVLLQQGKGADIGAVMGGGSSSLFGVGGASSLLVKTTTFIAVLFMLTSVLLVRLAATGGSVTGSRGDITEGLNLEALGVKKEESTPSAGPSAGGAESSTSSADTQAAVSPAAGSQVIGAANGTPVAPAVSPAK
jgi:preprotein translocase subunit SecG